MGEEGIPHLCLCRELLDTRQGVASEPGGGTQAGDASIFHEAAAQPLSNQRPHHPPEERSVFTSHAGHTAVSTPTQWPQLKEWVSYLGVRQIN